MGHERLRPPRYWRMRAEEFRAKAANAEHSQTKETLRKAAENYEQLARTAERIRTIDDLKKSRPAGDTPARPDHEAAQEVALDGAAPSTPPEALKPRGR